MLFALDMTAISIAVISAIGVAGAGWFGYLGIKAQVRKTGDEVATKVSELDGLNSAQHGDNSRLLHRMLDMIAEAGVMVSSMVNIQDRPIIKTDANGQLIQINPAGIKLLGMTLPELSGNGWLKAIHPEDRLKVLTSWRESIAKSKPFGPIAFRYRHPSSNVETLVEAVANPVINSVDDSIVSWVAVIIPLDDHLFDTQLKAVHHG